jgi:hypothetical protein
MDLVAINIQRGRDHGLPDYNTLRVAYGLSPVTSFADITLDTTLQAQLAAMYGDVDNLDAWVGGLAEDHLPSASVGPLVHASMVDQFTRLRDGDRFFYASDAVLTGSDIMAIINLDEVSLTGMIELNTAMTNMRPDFFAVPEPSSLLLLVIASVTSGMYVCSRRR